MALPGRGPRTTLLADPPPLAGWLGVARAAARASRCTDIGLMWYEFVSQLDRTPVLSVRIRRAVDPTDRVHPDLTPSTQAPPGMTQNSGWPPRSRNLYGRCSRSTEIGLSG